MRFILLPHSHARLATHFIPSNRLEDVKASLARGDHSLESINCVLEAFSGSYAPYTMDKLRPVIEECFSKYEVKDIEAAVRGKINSSDDEIAKWATMTLAQLEAASPTALFLTLELLKKARRESLTSCLRNEYAICYQLLVHMRMMASPDFCRRTRSPSFTRASMPSSSPRPTSRRGIRLASLKYLRA